MHFKKANWARAWKSYKSDINEEIIPSIINEATPSFINGVNRWIDGITDGGDYPLNDVLPWGDLFDGALRVVIPATSEDDENLAKIVLALRRGGWHPPGVGDADYMTNPGFPVKTVMQKKRRLGTGEVYEEETEVVKLDVSRTKVKVIPKGPRAGEEVRNEEATTMSRAINKATKSDKDSSQHIPAELAEWWQKKQTYYTQPQNAKKIEKLFTGAIQDSTTSDQAIVLSRHPVDVLRMGDIETVVGADRGSKIGHCHREGGEYERCAQQEALGHGPIAYLVNAKDLDYFLSGENSEQRKKNFAKGFAPHLDVADFDNKEIFSDADRDIEGIKAINRIRLRQFRDNETNEMWAVPEKQVYPGGSAVPGFLSAVRNWSWDKQKEMYEEAYEEGNFPEFDSFERLGGKYADTRDGILLNAFFSQSGIDPEYPSDWVRYEDEDADELEPSVEELAERMDDRVQEIMEAMNQRMEHASVHGEVEVYDEDAVCLMSGNMGVSFNEDLFGEDGGAEWELPSDWREQSAIAEAISSALAESPHYIYINTEDMQIDEYGNMVTFSFYINNEEYENNADGFDRFADHVESEYDSNYDAIRRVMKRVLIREGFMGADAYENLHKQLADSEENEDTLYRHWDFDIDGNEITFQLKDPASLVDGFANLSGLYLGTIPAGTSLTYLFHDWQYEKSKEFDNLLIPTIRQLFDDAEKAALRQLSLPGVEAKEMHGLLLPSRAQFRLKQIYDSYNAPAHIYLQIKMEIDEDITEEQIEEIRYFLEYLDAESKIDIIQKAAVEIFDVFRIKAVEQKKIEERVTRLATNIIPSLNGLSLLELTRFAADIDPDMGTDHSHIDTLIERIHSRLAFLLPEHYNRASVSRDELDDATRALAAQLNLKKVQDGLAAAKESQASAAEFSRAGGDIYTHSTSDEDWELFQYGAAGKILGVSLSKAASGRPEATLDGLAGSIEGLVATVVGRIKDVVHTAIKDPASSRTVQNVTRAYEPDPMPEWYKQQLEKANLSANQILGALPPSALASPRSAERDETLDKLVDLLPESLSLIERIDAALGDPMIVPTRDELVDFISENPNQEINLDSPKGSRKAFGRGEENKVELPFDYGEYPGIINPADNMGWDIIIVPSASETHPNLIPVGHVAYSKDRTDKVGNDKIIIAPDGEYRPEDLEIISDFFETLDGFDPIRWY
jgi:hypothetical protein